MTNDGELLRRYAEEQSEPAFAELVRRHLSLVYFAALRQLGGRRHLAEDVSQKVFVLCARKAGVLQKRPELAGWLYKAAGHLAARAARTERRRQVREHQAHFMNENQPAALSDPWEKIRPAIDRAISRLGENDRIALLLRFFEGRPFGEIAARLEISENAAQKRIERALERLRLALARTGVTSTSDALALGLESESSEAVPASLAGSVVTATAAMSAKGGMGLSALFIRIMSYKQKLGIAGSALAALAILGVATVAIQLRSNAVARLDLANLRRINRNLETERRGLALVRRRPMGGGGSMPGPSSASQAAVSPDGFVPVGALRNLGTGTPADALETVFWAKDQCDLEALARSALLPVKMGDWVKARFETLPDSVREALPDHPSAEQMALFSWVLFSNITAVQVTTQAEQSPGISTVSGYAMDPAGKITQFNMTFQKTPDGWRWVMGAGGDLGMVYAVANLPQLLSR